VNAVREKLAVTHILEGSFFRDGDRVKIKTWLRDAAKGSEVWTQSYDPMDKDVFTVRREVPLAVIGALDVVIPDSARARLIDKSPPTKNAEAYTRFVQGLACYHHGGKELHARAQELFEQAVALDPNYAEACAVLARSYLQGARLGWSKQPALALAKSLELTEKALSLDNSLEAAHLNMATLKLMRHEHDSAVAQAEKAVAMCPGYADTLATVGMIMVCVGRPEDGLKLATRAMRLNPITPSFYFHVVGDAYMDTKQYDEAVAAYNKGLLNHPDNVALRTRLVAAYIVTGKEKEAREAATELVRRSPAFSLARLAKQMPCKSYPHGEQFMEALRKAGLK
jgi:adenylate cyclase